MIGCGDSKISEHLHDTGLFLVYSCDISPVVISAMTERYKHTRPAMVWDVANALLLDNYSNESFDLVVDKGMSDTLQFRAQNKDIKPLLAQLFNSVYRVLKKGGRFLIFTPKPRVKRLYDESKWGRYTKTQIEVTEKAKLDTERKNRPAFCYECVKHSD